MKHLITYSFLRALSILLSLIPRGIAIFFAKKFGTFISIVYPKRKKVAIKNIKIAFPDKSKSEIEELIKKTYRHYMVLIIDFLRQNKFNISKINMDSGTKKILSSKDGLILMTAHIGNWEMIIPILSKYKKTSAIVKIQRDSGGDKFVSKLRNLKNITLLPMGSSKRRMIDTLKNGEVLALASDQNAGDKGTKIPFFGKEASIPKGAAYFYYKTKCPIAIGFCILKEDNSYEFKLEQIKPKIENLDESLFIEINTIYSKLLENIINKHPEQYFWFHKKWDRKIYT